MTKALRTLWAEPRPANPPRRVWRDWALLGVAVAASLIEAVLRPDRTWLLAALVVSGVVAVAVLWRRTQPLAAVAVAFGTLIVFDVARIVASDATGLASIALALVLPYALLRWGSGREAVIGLGIILVWVSVTLVAVPTTVPEVVAGYGFFLFSAALGAAIRFHATTRMREIEQAELRQRHELARDLHDTIGHYMSGIVIQAQAGRALAASDPDRALAVLETIEQAATRVLAEMRTIVGVLRVGAEPDLAPQPGLADIERFARAAGTPRIEVDLSDLHDLPAEVSVALYRIAQEALTNTMRHACNVTRVHIDVVGDVDRVRLTVRDDGVPTPAGGARAGYGLVSMRERATLLGGTFHAGPTAGGGWQVEAMLPRVGATS
ncbi:histidine kinase [Nesterenkonia xinjiangensis]|uniref:histidine kinase n=1 Tax=Nesterenkonia xinjiangensis TaxID=225327 RepID=A0A7Z0KDC6_9MICC|nr:signal transduction histidine kinase [Nesterenkonia xinjiangensis]